MNNSSTGVTPLLQVTDLKKDFQIPGGILPILKGAHLRIQPGEMTFILGRSGSGKSTFLHLIGGLDTPTSGQIFFEGQDLTKLSERKFAKLRNTRLGFVFQFYHLLPELTVYENVLLPSIMSGKKDEKWVKEILRQVKLLSRQDFYPTELSGGEKQRVAIARALVNKPSLILCDEPTGNLDEETADTVFAVIEELNQKHGHSFLIVTHDESLAWRYPHRIFRLHEGLLIKEERGPIPVERVP